MSWMTLGWPVHFLKGDTGAAAGVIPGCALLPDCCRRRRLFAMLPSRMHHAATAAPSGSSSADDSPSCQLASLLLPACPYPLPCASCSNHRHAPVQQQLALDVLRDRRSALYQLDYHLLPCLFVKR